MGLKFKDIDKWKPTSISIVDKPSHPMAVFEVYEDDEDFIKKYSPINEVDNLSNQEEVKDETVTMSSSFFEKLFGGLVSKAEEPPKPEEEEAEEEIKLEDILAKLEAFEERISKLENPEEEDVVAKSEEGTDDGETEGQEEDATEEDEDDDEEEEKPLDDMVKKSKEVDPDLNKGSSAPTESLMKRIGRTEDGMKW